VRRRECLRVYATAIHRFRPDGCARTKLWCSPTAPQPDSWDQTETVAKDMRAGIARRESKSISTRVGCSRPRALPSLGYPQESGLWRYQAGPGGGGGGFPAGGGGTSSGGFALGSAAGADGR
jgi:hypothetical protein